METTIRINTDQLSSEIIEGIRQMFPHKTVDITIQPADDTEFILHNPAYMKELEERIADFESNKKIISLKSSELL